MILGKQKTGEPSKWDILLAMAEAVLESERCPQCGHPRYQCQNEDNDIAFRAYEETCYAMRKKAQHEKGKEGKDRTGIVVGTEPYALSGTPLTEFRAPYYAEREKKREQIVAARTIIPREHPPGWTPSS